MAARWTEADYAFPAVHVQRWKLLSTSWATIRKYGVHARLELRMLSYAGRADADRGRCISMAVWAARNARMQTLQDSLNDEKVSNAEQRTGSP